MIYKVGAQGGMTVLAGSLVTGNSTPADGTGSAAVFGHPRLLGMDGAGNLYASDYGATGNPPATLYRKNTPQGVVTTIAALPAGLNAAPDGATYSADSTASVIYRTGADGSKTVAAGVSNVRGTRLGALPGGLDFQYSGDVVPAGPGSFAVISGAAVLRLVVPH